MDTKLKERIREKLNVGFNGLKPDIRKPAIENLTEIIEDIYSEVEQSKDTKVSSADIKLLIQEMNSRFDENDKRWEANDKRWDDMLHYIDKRFEAVDKRFEDLIHYMDKRFLSLQWFIGIGFTLLAALITIFTYFNQLPVATP